MITAFSMPSTQKVRRDALVHVLVDLRDAELAVRDDEEDLGFLAAPEGPKHLFQDAFVEEGRERGRGLQEARRSTTFLDGPDRCSPVPALASSSALGYCEKPSRL